MKLYAICIYYTTKAKNRRFHPYWFSYWGRPSRYKLNKDNLITNTHDFNWNY